MFSKTPKTGKDENRKTLLTGASVLVAAAAAMSATPAFAQDDEEEAIVVTGTRIQQPGLTSSSPISTVSSEALDLQPTSEIETVIRSLPAFIASDGQNVNNGTVGVTTLDLRGLSIRGSGAPRTLVLLDGRRMTPYSTAGLVDVSSIPTSLIERIDVVTGGASAVYGSDAMAGAVNFVLNDSFEGVESNSIYTVTGENDGETFSQSLTLGANTGDGRGNVALNINYAERIGVQLADRPYGIRAVNSATGAGLTTAPPPSPANCTGNSPQTDLGGPGINSTTAPAQVIFFVGGSGQFRDDGTFGAECNTFNFNPFNYYQTPNERWSGFATGSYEINPHFEAYGRVLFSNTSVRQQIAPSGVFFDQFTVPLQNPYLSAAARTSWLNAINTARALDPTITLAQAGVVDTNTNGVFDAADSLQVLIGRRTVEIGPRSTTYTTNALQVIGGLRGELSDDWRYDVYYSYGNVDRTQLSAGYSNKANIANALNATNTTTCNVGGATCVPINLFGPLGSITPAMAAYAGATAILKQDSTQEIAGFDMNGSLPIQSPWASSPLALAFGMEYRNETAANTPDECLKLPPTSCLGGAGGTTLPVNGEYSALDVFVEGIVPLVEDQPLFRSLTAEFGYRRSDIDPSGEADAYKFGFNWEPVEGLLIRAMRQQAVRAPVVAELFQPLGTGLANSNLDPCSVAQPVAGRTPALRALCESTGQLPAQVWTTPNIVAGQSSVIFGTDPANLPAPETANTTTYGFVLSPDLGGFLRNPTLTVDYYDIEIEDWIGTFSANEIIQGCYTQSDPTFCSLVNRINGNLITPGAGYRTTTRNQDYLRAEGIEAALSFGVDFERLGSVDVQFNVNKYLTNEYQAAPALGVVDCLNYYGNTCGNPTPEIKWTQRTTWSIGDWRFSYLWRHTGAVELEPRQRATVFNAFEQIDAYDFIDLTAGYDITENANLQFGVNNVTEELPPIIGNTTGTTGSNSGNTLPSAYDVLGRVYTVQLNVRF